MNWDDLRIFTHVARRARLSDAASALKMDETTISRRIKRLEAQLSQTLFERNRRGHQLTPQGQALLDRVQAMDSTATQIYETVGGGAHEVAGNLRISTAEGFGASVFVPAIRQFITANPHIHIDLVSGSGFLSLSRREADISIGLSRPKSKRIISRKLYDYSLGLYGCESYLNNNMPKSISDLEHHVLIGYIDDLVYAPELGYFETMFPYYTPKIRCSSILAQSALVRDGAGLAILPAFLASPDMVRLFPDTIGLENSFWLSAHKTISETGRFQALDRFLQTYFETL